MNTIRTYDQLDQIAQVFAGGGYNLLVLLGRPGLSKTRSLRAAMEDKEGCLWIRNTVTAFRLYQDLYLQRDRERLVIDDVDSFYSDRSLVRLLKCLCETEDVKHLAWHTDSAQLRRGRIPREFEVKMQVAIISNDLKQLNANVGALEDRGRVFRFEPDAREVHERAKTWFEDGEILGFVEEWLGLLGGRISLRDYVKLAQDKNAGLDWRSMFVEDKGLTDGDDLVILSRLLTMPFQSDQLRAREYERLTGNSRATYYRHKKAMRASAMAGET